MPKVIHKNKLIFAHVNNSHAGYIAFCRLVRLSGLTASLLLITIFGLATFPITNIFSNVEAASGTATTSDTVLAMVSGYSSADLSLAVTDSNGTFSSSSADELAKYNIATNNYTGYTLSITGSNNNGLLTNTDSSITTNNTLSSITSAVDSATFDTSSYNGKWGYLPSKYNSATNTSFRPAPTTTASTLDSTNTSNTKKTGASGNTVNCTNYNCNEYTIGLGARVDYTKPAGTYTNTFTLSAVANPISYSISYADNTSDSSVAGLPTNQTGSITTTSVTLSSTVPTRTGYTFSSWCLGTVSSNGTVCTGTTYNSGASFGIDQTSGNNVTLYATWTASTYDITIRTSTGISSVSLNGTTCTSTSGCTVAGLNYGQTYTLTATVQNGYQFFFWGGSSIADIYSPTTELTVVGAVTITPSASKIYYPVSISNTNTTSSRTSMSLSSGDSTTVTVTPDPGYYLSSVSCPSGYTCSGYGTGEYFTGPQIINIKAEYSVSAGGTLSFVASPLLTYFQTAPYSQCGEVMHDNRGTDEYKSIEYTTAEINGLCWMTRNLDLPGGTTLTPEDSNVTSDYTLPDSSKIWGASYLAYVYNSNNTECGAGIPCYSYYSYIAATASTNPSSGNATSDICPKGWRLPTYLEYDDLINTYTTAAAITSSPFLGVYGGEYRDDSSSVYGVLVGGGSTGHYWSSTPSGIGGDTLAYYLDFYYYGDTVDVAGGPKTYGRSVRCVKEDDERLYFQDATYAQCGEIMYDNRGANSYKNIAYTTAVIGNNCWMTRTLDLPSGITLTSADSNVESDYTLPPSGTVGFTNNATESLYNSGSTSCSDGSRGTPCYSYYTFTVASAGTDTSSVDICPKGWRLPTYSDYSSLVSASSPNAGENLAKSPFKAEGTGYFANGSHIGGSDPLFSYFWTSSVSILYPSSSSPRTSVTFLEIDAYRNRTYLNGTDVYMGYGIRCVFNK